MTKSDKIAQIYKTEYDSFIRRAFSILKNQEDAEDSVQTGITNAFRYQDSFKSGNMRAWCYRCVINSALNLYRKKKRTPYHYSIENCYDVAESQSFYDTLSDEFVDILDKLTDTQRIILELRKDRLRYRDIADFLGIKNGTVMSNLWRARNKIKIELNRLKSAENTLHE